MSSPQTEAPPGIDETVGNKTTSRITTSKYASFGLELLEKFAQKSRNLIDVEVLVDQIMGTDGYVRIKLAQLAELKHKCQQHPNLVEKHSINLIAAAEQTLHNYERTVTFQTKNKTRITHLGNPQAQWSPRSTADIIQDIETGEHIYSTPNGTLIQIINTKHGKHLRTMPNNKQDRLADLPTQH